MEYLGSFRISASGMAVEKTRLDIAALNIANMHSAGATPGAVYRPLQLLAQSVTLSFAQQFGQQYGQLRFSGGGVRVASVEPQDVAPRMVYEPGHPYADAKGFVAYPGVDHTAEMMNLNSALRAYEANVAALGAAKAMAARALEIGGK
ncbi:flagellar basal body rod protein FlgC [Massilia sp. TSP1-1-2]|uniref:flagellar basal body rod protein FlgC n=1 Tax=Massilia sp. TSP1-1-2 TaxID=2804649 RepID=UPI003CF77B12